MKKILLFLVATVIMCGGCFVTFDIKAQQNRVPRKSTTTTKKTTTTNKSTNNEAGPAWIDGTWTYSGYIDTFFGTRMKTNMTLIINRSNRTLVFKDASSIIEQGKYSVYDGSIHCNQTYFKLDEKNHRIEVGNGDYYTRK